MPRDAQEMLYDRVEGEAGGYAIPGSLARNRYASSRRPSFSFEDSGAGEAREDAVISNGIA